MSPTIAVAELVKVYPAARRGERPSPTVALDGVDLTVEQGAVHGVLGPNGAGKTTLVKILATMLLPTSGRVAVAGHDALRDPRGVRRRIGVVLGGDRGLYPRLTGRENLRYWAALHGLRRRVADARSEELLAVVGLEGKADVRVDRYSRGMRQRLHLARGLLARPEVLFLDEPTLGMDPVATRDWRSTLLRLRDEGLTTVLTTHDLREAEALCDLVTLLRDGRVVATGPPRSVGPQAGAADVVHAEGVDAGAVARLRRLEGVVGVEEPAPGAVRLRCADREAQAAALAQLARGGATSIRAASGSLEDAYLAVYGGEEGQA